MKKHTIMERDGKLYFYRLTLNQRIQHAILFISFTLLAFTGLPLKYLHTWWGPKLYALAGGITIAPVIHRISAVVMSAVFVFHICYILVCTWNHYLLPLRKRGKLRAKHIIRALSELPMVPNLNDLKELMATLKYFLFITNKRPSLAAHGLKEKFGYLAVFWGVPVIGFSGYLLWGETLMSNYIPGSVLNLALIAHGDEALLACLVIFGWHLYNTHLALAPFPMGKAWFTGYLSEREMQEDHYRDYETAMKKAGLQDRIKPNSASANFTTSRSSIIGAKLYMTALVAVFVFATVLINRSIFLSVFGAAGHDSTKAAPEMYQDPIFLQELILESTKKEGKTFYRGFRVIEERKISDHYHRIELNVVPDTISPCIKCHGDFPHGSSKKLRAFLNMHALHFACETCHVRPPTRQAQLQYCWYDRSTGDPVAMPKINEQPPDMLGLKLGPCESCEGGMQFRASATARAFADNFIAMIQTEKLDPREKQEAVKRIHADIAEMPVACQECHSRERPFLPLRQVGYSTARTNDLLNDDLVKMVDGYEEFMTPKFLEVAWVHR